MLFSRPFVVLLSLSRGAILISFLLSYYCSILNEVPLATNLSSSFWWPKEEWSPPVILFSADLSLPGKEVGSEDGLSLAAREAALNERKWTQWGWLWEVLRYGEIPSLIPHSGTFIQRPRRSSPRQAAQWTLPDEFDCSYTMCHTLLLDYSSF
jgi:hypothetical protein